MSFFSDGVEDSFAMNERPYNAANRKDVREAEKGVVVFKTINREVVAGIMSLPNGRWWMHELLAKCQTYADPFSPDPYIHAYHSGRKAMGTLLHNDIMLYAPQQYETMLREAYERSVTDAARRANAQRSAEPESDPYADPGADAAA